MIAEDAVVFDLDYIVLILRIFALQVLQNSKLHTCLVLVAFFVLDYLHGYNLICLVVIAS